MLGRTPRLIRYTVWTAAVILLFTTTTAAQEVVPVERLDDWFYSRLGWGLLLAAIFGVLVGCFHVSRLKFPPTLLDINNLARKRVGLWLIFVFVLGGLWLLFDASRYPFTDSSLNVGEAFGQVWLNWRTLVTILMALVSFVVMVAVTTRYAPWSRCRYPLWPSPQGK